MLHRLGNRGGLGWPGKPGRFVQGSGGYGASNQDQLAQPTLTPVPTAMKLMPLGDFPGAGGLQMAESLTALYSQEEEEWSPERSPEGGGRSASPLPTLSPAVLRTHASLQLCIMWSCSPTTALQAASSLVHFSWWVASARQKWAPASAWQALRALCVPPCT